MNTFLKHNYGFDDYLKLNNYNFSPIKYIIFSGNSGSGKSSYINNLLKVNKSLKNKNIAFLNNIEKIQNCEIIVIDEILNIKDYFKIIKYFFQNKQLIIASHINQLFFYPLKLNSKVKFFKTDTNISKIKKYLKNKKMNFSDYVIKDYIKNYSATYTDIDIIIERYNGNNFDNTYLNFQKHNKITFSINNNIKK